MEENDIFKTETIYDRMVHEECVRCWPDASRSRLVTGILIETVLLGGMLRFGDAGAIHGFLICAAVFLAAYYLPIQICLGPGYRKALRPFGGVPWHTAAHIRRDGIRIVNRQSKAEASVPFDRIRRIIDTPRLVLLVTDDRQKIVLQKSWLTGGTPEELTAWLTEACPHVRKIREIRSGRLVRRVVTGTMIAGSILGLLLLFWRSNAPAGKTYAEIAEELAPLGITVRAETLTELEAIEEAYGDMFSEAGYTDADLALNLLCMEGMGTYDFDSFEWTPSDSGVYWFDTEVLFAERIYTDFFAGLSAMDAELDFTNVQEDYSAVDIEGGTGTLPVRFDWNGNQYALEARYDNDWFDTDILSQVSRIIARDGSGGRLWCAFDGGQGVLLYYGTAEEVRALEQVTGISFRDAASPLRWY